MVFHCMVFLRAEQQGYCRLWQCFTNFSLVFILLPLGDIAGYSKSTIKSEACQVIMITITYLFKCFQ